MKTLNNAKIIINMEHRTDAYKQIKTKDSYNILLKSGMFWEFHPELTGNWEADKKFILTI